MHAHSNKPCLSLVIASIRRQKVVAKRSKRTPALPRCLSAALKGLERGSVEIVCVGGVIDGRLFNVSAGQQRELLDILYKPVIPAPAPSVAGNVISIQRAPTPVEQIVAAGEAFAAGRVTPLHLVIRHAGGKVEQKTLIKGRAGKGGRHEY